MTKEIKIGVFTVAMILVAWGGIRFLSGIDLLSSNDDYYAQYASIDGVQNASPVFIKGVKVGTVTGIALDEQSASMVEIQLTIADKYRIPKNSQAKIFTNGLMGGKAINLILGDSDEYIEVGGVIPSACDVDLFEVAGTELEYLKGRIDTVTTQLSSTLSALNTLIEGNTENLGGMISNMNTISLSLKQLLQNNSDEITQMVGGFADFSKTLGDNSSQIDSIIRNVNTLTADLGEANLGEALSSSLTNIDQLLSQLNSSEGNVGKLLRDEAIYDNLVLASANLDSLICDVKENPKRYVNISVFGNSGETRAQARAAKIARKDTLKSQKN